MNLPGIGDPIALTRSLAAQGLIHFPSPPVVAPEHVPVFNMTCEAIPAPRKGARPGEWALKDWLNYEAGRLGIAYRAMEMRFNRGKCSNIKVRRVNRKIVFVTPK